MSDEVKITMNGEQIISELRAFKEDLAIKTVKSSTRRIGTYLQKQVKAAVAQRTGKLFRNIAVRAKYILSRSVVVAKVVVNTRGKAGDPKNAFYWRFYEMGHKTRPGKNVMQHEVNGSGVIRGAFENAQSQIQSMFYSDLQKAIGRAKARNRKG